MSDWSQHRTSAGRQCPHQSILDVNLNSDLINWFLLTLYDHCFRLQAESLSWESLLNKHRSKAEELAKWVQTHTHTRTNTDHIKQFSLEPSSVLCCGSCAGEWRKARREVWSWTRPASPSPLRANWSWTNPITTQCCSDNRESSTPWSWWWEHALRLQWHQPYSRLTPHKSSGLLLNATFFSERQMM